MEGEGTYSHVYGWEGNGVELRVFITISDLSGALSRHATLRLLLWVCGASGNEGVRK